MVLSLIVITLIRFVIDEFEIFFRAQFPSKPGGITVWIILHRVSIAVEELLKNQMLNKPRLLMKSFDSLDAGRVDHHAE